MKCFDLYLFSYTYPIQLKYYFHSLFLSFYELDFQEDVFDKMLSLVRERQSLNMV